MDLNSLLTQGVRKAVGRRSEWLWSIMSVPASSTFFWGQFKVQTDLSQTSSTFLQPSAMSLSHKASCYWSQLISGSQETIAWGSDNDFLSEAGKVPHLLAPGPRPFFHQSLRSPLMFRCPGPAFPLTWTSPPCTTPQLSWTIALFTTIKKETTQNWFCIDQCLPIEET